VDQLLLLSAYTRRRQWESEIQAAAIWNLLAQAMARKDNGNKTVPAAELLRMMGEP
jgi:hypothetical protein